MVAMNKPVTHIKAGIGRRLFLGHLWEHDLGGTSSGASPCNGSNPRIDQLNGLFAAQFSRHQRSSLSLRLRKEDLQGDFDISLRIRTYDQDGLIFASIVR